MNGENENTVKLTGLGAPHKDKTYVLDKEEFLIGRARDCDLRMEENTISGRHAKILKVQDHYEIEDLQSTNGTFLNDMRVSRKRLRSGDKIKFDQFEFLFTDPSDVSRTIVATPSLLAEAQKTVVRPHPPSAVPLSPAPTTAPSPAVLSRPSSNVRGGSAAAGVVVAVILAFLIGLGGNILFQQILIAGSGGSLLGSAWDNAKSMARIYPTMHQAHLWVKADFSRWQNIVSILLIVLSVVLAGMAAQAIGRRKRIPIALAFGAVFVLAALVMQIACLQFRIQALPLLYAGLVRGLPPWPSFALGIAYIFGVVFVLSLVGTLLVRRGR